MMFLICLVLGHAIFPLALSVCSFFCLTTYRPDVSLHDKSTCVLVEILLGLRMLAALSDIHLRQRLRHDFIIKLAGDQLHPDFVLVFEEREDVVKDISLLSNRFH